MSTNSTASNYILKINEAYPVAGQDNSTQGFRNNFKNIKTALSYTDQELNDLKISAVKLTTSNNFNNNVIKSAVFQNCSDYIYDNSETTELGDIEIDYENGSYQKFKVSSGLHTISVINWPENLKAGKIIVSIISDSLAGTSINFSAENLINLGPDPFPVEFTGTNPQLFEIWNDGDTGRVYVKGLGGNSTPTVEELIALATATYSVKTLRIGGTNLYSTSTNSTTNYATVVTADDKAGNLAVVPNRITVNTTNAAVPDIIGDSTATTLAVNTTSGIILGSKVDFPNSTSTITFTVTAFTTSTITLSPAFEVNAFSVGDPLTFTNPRFDNQPTVITFSPNLVTTTTSIYNELKGELYANSTTLYVSYNDYEYGQTNKIKISGDNVTMVTQLTATNDTSLATTEFVHNVLPYGAIIMWHGNISNIPNGWALCDGDNGTPNLVNRFIVGAGVDDYDIISSSTRAFTNITGTNSISGGSTSTSVVADHDHNNSTTSVAITIPGSGYSTNGVAVSNAQNGTLIAGSGFTEISEILESLNQLSGDRVLDGHSHEITADGEHSHLSLPPFYALCYIMKITGN